MSVNIQTGNVVKIQSGNRVLISAPGPQGPAGTGGTPGGTDTQVQFNDSSAFGGDAGLTYNKSTDTLSATNLTVSGVSTLNHIHGSLAGNLYVRVKNTTAGTLAKGTPVYATGSVGASGEIEVAAADYTNSAKMPAIGILDAALGVNAEGNAVVVGEVMELATNSYAINQELFVGTNGLLSALPASGQAQSIAVVSRVHASTGIIVVNAQARLNAALTALANNNGASLTGITAAQVGAVANGDSPTFDKVTLTNGIINSQTGALAYNFYDVVNSSAIPFIAVSLYDDQGTPALIGSSLFGFRGDGAGSGKQIFQGSTNNFQFEGVGGANTADVYAQRFLGSGQNLTSLNAGNISTGTLGVARGGTGAATLTANNVLLGNGTSTLLEVAPGTTGNVLTSNGTTWTSAAPTTGANPAGTGSELQFRSTGTTFGALTSSSVSGANLTLGGLLTVTPAAANTGYFSGTGYSLTGSDTTAMLNLAGTWNTTGIANGIKLDVTDTASAGNSYLMHLTVGGANRFRLFKDGGLFCAGTVNGTNLNASSYFGGGDSGQFILGGSLDTRLQRDAAAVWAMRNGTNAHTLRIYETDSGANDEYLEISAASGTNTISPKATGTGTASVVRYHTTTTVFWTSGSGSPESVVTAPVGSMYTDTAGGAATTLYVKESGTGSTGWVAK